MNNMRIDDTPLRVFFDEKGRSTRRVAEKSTEPTQEVVSVEEVQEKKYSKKQLIAAVVAAVVISSSLSAVATNRVEHFVEQQEQIDNLDESLSSYKLTLGDILHGAAMTEKIYTGNIYQDTNRIVDYDSSKIASSIEERFETQKDKDIAIYTLYKYYDRSSGGASEAITSKTVRCMKDEDGKFYSGLHDYVAKKGFESISEYDQKMQDIVIDNYADKLASGGGKQWK